MTKNLLNMKSVFIQLTLLSKLRNIPEERISRLPSSSYIFPPFHGTWRYTTGFSTTCAPFSDGLIHSMPYFNILFNISFPSVSMSLEWCLIFGFSEQNCVCIYYLMPYASQTSSVWPPESLKKSTNSSSDYDSIVMSLPVSLSLSLWSKYSQHPVMKHT